VSAQLSQAATFGKYQILGRIAVGGMAEIYKARVEGEGGFHRTFALKRILPHLTSRQEFVDMLVEEAKVAGLLSHANIVQIMDLGQVAGTYYIAMEYVDGPDLGRILRRCRDKGITLPVPHAVFLVIEVLKALEYAHHRRVLRGGREVPLNIVHRDVSPANVLVSFQGEVKLTDFGIAKASIKALETVSGIIKGRFDYLAPEQAAGDKPDRRADLFAVGVVLYECLTGRHPFRARSEAATLDAIREGRFPPPAEINPDVPYGLELILERALAADPAARFQTATEMKEALDRFFHDAGFIFSHSTLAAFLKGLFPEDAGRSRKADRVAPTVEQHEDPSAPLLTDEQPTRLLTEPDSASIRPTEAVSDDFSVPPPDEPFSPLDSTVRKPRVGLAAAPDMPGVADLGSVTLAGFGEEATLIRPQPTAPLSPPDDWGEAPTVIKTEPPPTARPAPPHPDRPSVSITQPASANQPLPLPAPRPANDTIPLPRAPRTSWRVHAGYMVLVVVCSVLMLFVGVLVTRWRLETDIPTAAVVQHEPQLRVEVPDGATLRVDGRLVPGSSPLDVVLTAGDPHRIEVEVEGYNPYQTRLTLAPNDVRVLSVQTECLQPQRR